MIKSMFFPFFSIRGSFHPLKTKSTPKAYITFGEGGKMSLISNFQSNRCSYKEFGGIVLFLSSVTGLQEPIFFMKTERLIFRENLNIEIKSCEMRQIHII